MTEKACLSQSVKPKPTQAESHSEQLVRDHAKLQERYQRTTSTLASAAHDLKTPLAILNGYVELLQSEKLGPLTERQREVLRDMRSSGQRLQRFIQDFLSFSVLETGEMKMRYETGRPQCLPFGSLPVVVAALSGEESGALLPGERASLRRSLLMRPRWSA